MFFTLAHMMQTYETVKRDNCRDCGNPWWWSLEECYSCTMCGKNIGRDTSDTYVPKEKK